MELEKNFVSFEEELKRNPELKKDDINNLREWCQKQPHLPKVSDSMLALFLHSNHYMMEPTKSTIENYYTVRTHLPELFGNRDPVGSKEIRQTMKVVCNFPLEKPSRLGYNIIYGRLLDTDPSNYNYFDSFKFFNMSADLWMRMKGSMKGHVLIIDMTGVVLGHVGRLSPLGIKKFLYYLQEGMPVRLKGLHFLFTTSVMDLIMNMMKPFMKKELMNVLYLHPNVESITKHIPLEHLPNEVGGQAGSVHDLHSAQVKLLEQYRDWFIEEEANSKVDESKRAGKAKTASDIFGVEGSFKKLDID